jgi:hypothetical protein
MTLRRTSLTVARIAVVVTALAAAGAAMAQSADHAGTWESKFGLMYNGSWDSGFSGGSTADVSSELGFDFGVSYFTSDRLSFGGSFEYDSPSYTASLVNSTNPNQIYNIRGSLENIRFLADATYYFLDQGPFNVFGSALVGWTWTDTNIATSPPQTGCWWDPWWGLICTSWQNTRTIDGFSYGLALGGRYDFSRTFAMEASYRLVWTDYGNATGTPSQDGFKLTFNWKF